ncbi:hypothetical protein ATANTOWER_026955 [Ataeniobius toweri]|uniref:Uncharacterized protein n=1 Tax=Ataeniobius toweri TaxID=208326 RepID=A0ABU7AH47_9TELE|nr:hypothetical protein [Ataeniobius toweri]
MRAYRVSPLPFLTPHKPERPPSNNSHHLFNPHQPVPPPSPQHCALFTSKTVQSGLAEWTCPSHMPSYLFSSSSSSSHTMEPRATQHPHFAPTRNPRGSQAAYHSAFHNSTVHPSLCISV